jgi:hypothetical protein
MAPTISPAEVSRDHGSVPRAANSSANCLALSMTHAPGSGFDASVPAGNGKRPEHAVPMSAFSISGPDIHLIDHGNGPVLARFGRSIDPAIGLRLAPRPGKADEGRFGAAAPWSGSAPRST